MVETNICSNRTFNSTALLHGLELYLRPALSLHHLEKHLFGFPRLVPNTIILNCSSGPRKQRKTSHKSTASRWKTLTDSERERTAWITEFCALSCYPNLPLTRRSHCLRRVILQTKCSVKRMADHLFSFSEKFIEKHPKTLHKMETKKVYVYMSYYDMCYIIYIHTRTHNLFTAYWSTDCTSLQALELHVKASR